MVLGINEKRKEKITSHSHFWIQKVGISSTHQEYK